MILADLAPPGDRYTRLAVLILLIYLACFGLALTALIVDHINLLEYFGVFFFVDKIGHYCLDNLTKRAKKHYAQ